MAMWDCFSVVVVKTLLTCMLDEELQSLLLVGLGGLCCHLGGLIFLVDKLSLHTGSGFPWSKRPLGCNGCHF